MSADTGQLKGKRTDIAVELASISELTIADLRAEWRRLYRSDPPKAISRDLLELAVAWKLQEKALGGHSYATRQRLKSISDTLDAVGKLARRRARSLKPGARLVRTWHGETHTVRVTDDGYEWRGKRWQSLTSIAREITGTKWSGPRFFGLSGQNNDAARTVDPSHG